MVLLGLTPFALAEDSRARMYAWFDTLGYSSLLKTPLVKVDSWKWADGKKKYGLTHSFGFQLSRSLGHVSLISLEAERVYFPPREPFFDGFWSTKELRLVPWAKRIFGDRKGLSHETNELLNHLDNPISLFILSRACSFVGEEHLSRALYSRSLKALPDGYNKAVYGSLKNQIAGRLTYSVIRDIEAPDTSWLEIRNRLRVLAKHCAGTEYFGLTKEYSSLLDQMVIEDQRRSRGVGRHRNSPDIDDLVYDLKNQRGFERMQPGYCEVFADLRGEKSPAAQLAKIGIPAVPALIRCLDNCYLSRSTAHSLRSTLPEETLRVRDVALQVLNRIAFRSFEANLGRGNLTDWSASRAKMRAMSWLNSVKKLGLAKVFVDDIRAMGVNYIAEAEALVDKFPGQSFEPVRFAVTHEGSSEGRARLVALLARVNDPRAEPLARRLATEDPSLSVRFIAAQVVGAYSGDSAINYLVAVLRNAAPAGRSEVNRQDVIDCLIASHRPEAIASIRAEVKSSEIPFTVDSLVARMTGNGQDRFIMMQPAAVATTALLRKEEETFLAGQLCDRRPIEDGLAYRGKLYPNVSVGEAAAAGLAFLAPSRYRFDLNSLDFDRNRQRVVILNTWRASRGFSILPVPTQHVDSSISTNAARLIRLILLSPTPGTRVRAESELKRLGPNALPQIISALKGAAKDSSKKNLRLIGSHLACTVVDVKLNSNVEGIARWRNRGRSLRGIRLTTHSIVSLLEDLESDFPMKFQTCTIHASRGAGGSGITLAINFGRSTAVGPNSALNEKFVGAGKELGYVSSMNVPLSDEIPYTGSTLDRLLGSSPESPFSFEIEMKHQVPQGSFMGARRQIIEVLVSGAPT
ncbi:hypothetical protein OP10G_2533 [Fimbriimonas ginsengisoli Gsoil 348]|uniref:HEAT repeat domain-containing protein n=2 Tax=Fimbriimonas ginsengisoli TaxID=1005039 RepID=A0A068NR35_FIMGI|nr:hypothetical protein OP10G_2533 [Fimbriimonas ginsengisoli Gsoil 348]